MTCHSASMAMAQANPPQGLATDLWHGLQVSLNQSINQRTNQSITVCMWVILCILFSQAALLSVITSLDMAAISGLTPPAPTPLLQVHSHPKISVVWNITFSGSWRCRPCCNRRRKSQPGLLAVTGVRVEKISEEICTSRTITSEFVGSDIKSRQRSWKGSLQTFRTRCARNHTKLVCIYP